jgi:hypothetical protein
MQPTVGHCQALGHWLKFEVGQIFRDSYPR